MAAELTDTIVFVEDEPSIATTTQFILESAGFEVATAATGSAGLALVRAGRPKLVLLDVELPDVSGVEVCKAIRQDPNTCNATVLFITTHEIDHIVATDPAVNADGYLRKPLDVDGLIDIVSRIMAGEGVGTGTDGRPMRKIHGPAFAAGRS
jgi:CheY-like chemotaxis protein